MRGSDHPSLGAAMWDPGQYLKFAGPRLRPALELLARVDLDPGEVTSVVDLGTGTGVMLPHLLDRFPRAIVDAVDNDPAMLERARAQVTTAQSGRVRLVDADAARWVPDTAVDLLYSNAALHWLDDHATLLPRLMAHVRRAGVLAVQMPRNFASPSHRLIAEVVDDGPWAPGLRPLLREWPVLQPRHYVEILTGLASDLDVWETEYVHLLEGPHPVAQWTKGAALRPLLAALADTPDMREQFWVAYRNRVTAAYPPLQDGRTPFPFRRLFLVARR